MHACWGLGLCSPAFDKNATPCSRHSCHPGLVPCSSDPQTSTRLDSVSKKAICTPGQPPRSSGGSAVGLFVAGSPFICALWSSTARLVTRLFPQGSKMVSIGFRGEIKHGQLSNAPTGLRRALDQGILPGHTPRVCRSFGPYEKAWSTLSAHGFVPIVSARSYLQTDLRLTNSGSLKCGHSPLGVSLRGDTQDKLLILTPPAVTAISGLPQLRR